MFAYDRSLRTAPRPIQIAWGYGLGRRVPVTFAAVIRPRDGSFSRRGKLAGSRRRQEIMTPPATLLGAKCR